VFYSKDWEKSVCQLSIFLGAGEQEQSTFKRIFTKMYFEFQNATQQQSCWRKCTTLVFRGLEVFKEIFVQRGEVLTGSKVQGVF
jgi:hypothetical protein